MFYRCCDNLPTLAFSPAIQNLAGLDIVVGIDQVATTILGVAMAALNLRVRPSTIAKAFTGLKVRRLKGRNGEILFFALNYS